jgi:hypothetical protein
MTNLIRLPPHTNMTAQQALDSAMVDAEDDYLKDVLIVGYTESGNLYVRSSKLTCAEAFFLANKAARWAQGGGNLDEL